jgi:chemotaxis protein histidine kinase CheA
MPTLNEYFRTEARDFLTALERSLQRSPGPDAGELHRAVRGLRGTAQMAREQRVFDVVSAFESVTRAIAAGALTWSESIAARARDTIADLRVLLDPTEDDEQLDARVSDAAARWREADPAPAPVAAPPVVDHGTREFREFAAREAAGIADTLDHGIRDLQTNPMDREPLTAILRRQRALLGSARLDDIPVLSDILRAVEDLTRVIVKLDVGVKQEWLDIYRVARDALQTTIAPLLRDELPQSSNSVSRLRHMREELLERYGSTADQPPPEDPLAPQTALHPAAPFLAPAPAAAGMVEEGTGQDDVLELQEDSVVDEATPETLQLGEESVVEQDAGTLELGEDAVVDQDAGTLELGEESVVEQDAGTLELGEESVADADVLELGEDSVVGQAGVLELGEESVMDQDAGTLELGEDSVVDEDGGMLELVTPAYSREEALKRALELRDVIARAAGHDPRVRDAVEELLDLIRTALG